MNLEMRVYRVHRSNLTDWQQKQATTCVLLAYKKVMIWDLSCLYEGDHIAYKTGVCVCTTMCPNKKETRFISDIF